MAELLLFTAVMGAVTILYFLLASSERYTVQVHNLEELADALEDYTVVSLEPVEDGWEAVLEKK